MAKADQVNLSTNNVVAIGSWELNNSNIKLSGLATSTTSEVVYYGINGLLTKGAISSGGFSQVIVQQFTSVGDSTYTPTANMKYCIVEVVGAGGGGGSAAAFGANTASIASGGGAGGYAMGVFSAADIGAFKPLYVGSAGLPGVGGVFSSFGGNLLSGAGGGGGSHGTAYTPQNIVNTTPGGEGGTGGGISALLTVAGRPGKAGTMFLTTTLYHVMFSENSGGDSYIGFGGRTADQFAVPQIQQAPIFGGGGLGAVNYYTNTTQTGFSGANGLVKITEFI